MKERKKFLPIPGIKSLKTRWILSCISLAMIPLVIGVVIFFRNVETFREQVLRNNEALLVQIHDMMDQGLRDTKAIVEDLTEDPAIPVFFTPQDKNLLVQKLRLQSQLSQYCLYSSYISDIYVYFPANREFITNQTVAEPDILYYMNHNSTAMNYQQWLSIIESPHRGETILLPASNDKTSIAYVKSIPSFSQHINANVIVILNTETMATMARNVSGEHSCEFNILYDRQPVLTPGILLAQNESVMEIIPVSRTPGISRTQGQLGTVLSSTSSDIMEFTYLLATPATAYQTPIRPVNFFFYAGFLVIILGSIGFTAWFVERNYSPIREIVQIASVGQDDNGIPEPADEYTMIKKALYDSRTASAAMMSQISKQQHQLLDTSLAMLLHRYPVSPNSQWNNHRETLRELLNYPFLLIGIIGQDNTVGSENSDALNSEQAEMLFSWLQRPEGFLEGQNIFYWISYLDGKYLILFGLSQKQRQQWDFFCHSFLQDIKSLESKQSRLYPNSIACYFSPFCTALEQLPDAWEEAVYAMRYKSFFGVEYTAKYEEISAVSHQDAGYYYPQEEEMKLINFIRSGETEKAEAVLEHLWKMNLEGDRTNAGFAQCLVFDIMGTLIRASSLVGPLSSVDTTITETMKKLTHEKNLSVMYLQLVTFLREVCRIYRSEHSKTTDRLKDDIFEYIGTHYSNPDLSVELIGDVFGKSRAYLFSLFKEDTGFSMLYHINKVRIEKAKELLLDKNMPIQDIAQQVGFNSSINFTRAFKKYEGITPSKYREMHR